VVIGRARKLGRLAAVLDKAQHGRPQVVLLASEAGAGKTCLLLKLPTDASSAPPR
jgi:predicted ATPase